MYYMIENKIKFILKFFRIFKIQKIIKFYTSKNFDSGDI